MGSAETDNERALRRSALSHATLTGILGDVGATPPANAAILDVGCGAGQLAYLMRRDGYRAFGIDVSERSQEMEERCVAEGLARPDERVFRRLDLDDYRFPFEDATFDLAYSDQLLEHVEDLELVLGECARVLKPGASCLHILPPRWMVIEPHFYVPFGGALPFRWYYYLWARLGVRNPYQKGMDPQTVVARNLNYWREKTHYRSATEIGRVFERQGFSVRFVNDLFIKNSPRAFHRAYPLLRRLPGASALVGTFVQLAIFATKTS